MSNFDFLNKIETLSELKRCCLDSEQFCLVSKRYDLSAFSARKALEFGVKLIYSSKKWEVGKQTSLLELIDNSCFREFIGSKEIVDALHYVRMVGNCAVHDKGVIATQSLLALKNLHFFIGEFCKKVKLIDSFVPFDENINLIPDKTIILEKSIQPINLSEADKIQVQGKITAQETFSASVPEYMTEALTRKLYIDIYLLEAGWEVLNKKGAIMPSKACIEIEVDGMPNNAEKGYVDYVLFGRDCKPLAIVEAKKTSVNIVAGRKQAMLYADCLERKYGVRPVIYYTNGYETKIIDGLGYAEREVSGFHKLGELELLIQRRNCGKIKVDINPNITDRAYQKIAITKMCDRFNEFRRKGLLVMATGTGKTRVAISLVDVLQRNKWVKNVLFLADRTALVSQARKNFAKLLPEYNVCELSDSTKKRDLDARIMLCTYQTMINFIDKDVKDFSIGRFDLIIIDEAHRSIFSKYRTIFTYFDSLIVGLTATPRDQVGKSTYSMLGCEDGEPNYEYTYDEAIAEKYLVNYEVYNKFSVLMQTGLTYSELSEEEKEEYESIFTNEEGEIVEEIDGSEIFKKVYNKDTVRKVLNHFVKYAIKVNSGDKIGKSIIFAYNHKHAELIVETFNEMYPNLGDGYCELIDNYVNYSKSLIECFEQKDKFPQIAVSVDMLDTGIDVPEVCNLVFFKIVKSKIKFLQMIGRGTRLSPNLFGAGKDKEKFYIFDYCGNFEYFEINPDGAKGDITISLTQKLFEIKLDMLVELQRLQYQEDEFSKGLYSSLKKELFNMIVSLSRTRQDVRENFAIVDYYSIENNWNAISKVDAKRMKDRLGSLVLPLENDEESAKAFDLKIYHIMLNIMDKTHYCDKAKKSVVNIAFALKKKAEDMATIPQIMVKLDVIKMVCTENFWANLSLSSLEKIREDLRELLKFLREETEIYDTDFGDELGGEDAPTDKFSVKGMRTYKQKIIDYLAEHNDCEVINKIKTLQPISSKDVVELENLLWNELGNFEDYNSITDKQNVAIFIRSLVGLDDNAINQVFSQYLSDTSLNSMQQELLNEVVNFIRQNGDIEKDDLVNTSPFENYDLVSLFGEKLSVVANIIEYMQNCVRVGA